MKRHQVMPEVIIIPLADAIVMHLSYSYKDAKKTGCARVVSLESAAALGCPKKSFAQAGDREVPMVAHLDPRRLALVLCDLLEKAEASTYREFCAAIEGVNPVMQENFSRLCVHWLETQGNKADIVNLATKSCSEVSGVLTAGHSKQGQTGQINPRQDGDRTPGGAATSGGRT